MSSTTEAQRLIALSLGKIALSRQQRGGINLHKNLLVASVLHKARTTYMMDNFQTLLANKRAQAEREAAAKMIVDTPNEKHEKTMDVSSQSRGFTDSNKANDMEVPHGERPEKNNNVVVDKENVVPVKDNQTEHVNGDIICDKTDISDKKSCPRDVNNAAPVVTGKVPLSQHNGNQSYVSQLNSCRCAGGKRRRSFVVECDSVTEPKKARYEDDWENSSDSESDSENDSGDNFERMQTESTQVKSLVDIFSSGFNGLCKDKEVKTTGQINVYVSADRSVAGHQYVLKDISCGTQIKDNVAIPTAIALAV